MKIEYIDNDYSKGIKYDLNFIVKECKKLKIFPDGVWNPLHLLTKNNGLNFLFTVSVVGSERYFIRTQNFAILRRIHA